MSIYTQPRFNPTDFLSLPIMPFGGEVNLGFNDEASALVNVSADGVDLNTIWSEVAQALNAWNAERGAIASLLSYSTTNTADAIPQSISDESFELASEYGEPQGLRAPSEYLLLGYKFDDYDKATRYTWKFLRNATAEQIRAVTNYAMSADQKLVQGTILERIFNPAPGVNEWGHATYGLYSADTFVPPRYLGRSFTAAHTHYLTSGADEIDSGDVEEAAKLVTEHGFGTEPNAKLLAFMNPAQADAVASWRAGVENANTVVAHHDYIPSAGAPAYLQPENLVGQVAPESFNGLKIQGSYGNLWVIQSDFIPEDYFIVAATYGVNSQNNVVGVRQHTNPVYQGLRIIPGRVPGYPLQEAFFQRSFGVGVRQRGAAAVVQIKASGSYDVPVIAK